jgi:hypothetical protein
MAWVRISVITCSNSSVAVVAVGKGSPLLVERTGYLAIKRVSKAAIDGPCTTDRACCEL